MIRLRRFAAFLSLSAAAVAGTSFFFYAPDASSAERRASKQVRRTASAASNANAAASTSGAPSESAASLRTMNGAAPSNAVAAVDETPKDAPAGGRKRETDLRPRSRRLEDPPNRRLTEPPKEGAQVKATTEAATLIKGSAAETARMEGPPIAARRLAEARASAAKGPAEPAPAKSTAEKFAADADVSDAPRPSSDPAAPNVRREISSSSGAVSAKPVVLTLEGPYFDGGDVPRAAASLDRMKPSFARCVPSEAALTKTEAFVDLRFLVRAPGRAEGVDVDKARGVLGGVSGDVVRCMTSVLARSYVGAPSDDPVGVAVTLRVKRPEPTTN